MLNSTSATAASSSTTATTLDDYNSDGKAEPEESDDLVVSSDDNNNDGNDDNVDNNVDEDIFVCAAQDIQNRTSQNAGRAVMEDDRFRELFRASIGIVLKVWHMMDDGGLLPKKTKPKHLLWTFYFMKFIPKRPPLAPLLVDQGVPLTLKP
jgi:hypothetical protein